MDRIVEEWRPVAGHEGLYEVSNLGRVRSVDGVRWNGQRQHFFKGRILKAMGSPYLHVALSKGGRPKTYRVHVLVAGAFLPVCPGTHGKAPGCYHVDHVNGDRRDNRARNLQWLTVRDNVYTKNPRALGKLKGHLHHNSKLTADEVRFIRGSQLTAREIAERLGISRDYVYGIRKGVSWRHLAET